MSTFKLIYFNQCPNYQPAIDLLQDAGIVFETVCQDRLDISDPYKNYSSPTLLKGDEIIFGARAHGGGCSVALPTIKQLLERI